MLYSQFDTVQFALGTIARKAYANLVQAHANVSLLLLQLEQYYACFSVGMMVIPEKS